MSALLLIAALAVACVALVVVYAVLDRIDRDSEAAAGELIEEMRAAAERARETNRRKS